MRTKHRRGDHDWTNRASFFQPGVALPEEADERPVVGTRNALALARANMGYDAQVREPEMAQTAHPANGNSYAPNQWGAHGNESYGGYPQQQNQYQQQYTQPGFDIQDPHQYVQHYGEQYDQQAGGDYGYHEQSHVQDQRYADLSRQLEVPPVALSPAPTHPADAGRISPPALGRSLSTSAYGSLSAQGPVPSHPTRTGTPIDSNPQQAYLAPNVQTGRNPSGSLHSRSSVYDDDAYGGI